MVSLAENEIPSVTIADSFFTCARSPHDGQAKPLSGAEGGRGVGQSHGGARREYGKAGPGRDYWIKEIRRKEMEYVERAEQAYERMVAAWRQQPSAVDR